MPVITMQMGKTTVEKKKELIEKFTETASEITSIPETSFVVFIEEHDYESIGVGGQTIAERMAKK